MRRLRAREVGFIVFAVLVGLLCLRLGLWQLDRLGSRRLANAEIRARQEMPPLDLNQEPLDTVSSVYRSAVVRGWFDTEQQLVLQNRSLNGEPGVHLVSPLKIDGQVGAILVDLGWLPLEQAQPAELGAYPREAPATVTGILLPSQLEPRWDFMADRIPAEGQAPLAAWRVLNIPGMQRQTPYPLLPLYLAATEPTGGADVPRPDVVLDLSEGPHLGYALQWFAFCAIAWVGAGLYARRCMRTPGAASSEAAR